MIRALLLDLDDTLLETRASHLAALDVACRHAGAALPGCLPAALAAAYDRAHVEMEDELEGGLAVDSHLAFRTLTWQRALSVAGLPLDLGEELARLYLCERRARFRLYDDVPSALSELALRYRLVLVTNGLGDLQREKVAAVGLERWLHAILISGEVASWKPDAGIFIRALAAAQAAPEAALMVGDSLRRDVAGAAALGISTVWMRRYDHLRADAAIRPDYTARSLHELEAALRELEEADGSG